MFAKIEEAIIKALQENLKDVKKGSIGSSKVAPKTGLPYVQVTNSGFKPADSGIGRPVVPDDKVLDIFDGDGEEKLFTLSDKPVRPLLGVEVDGMKASARVYTVDYKEGTVALGRPPKKGKGNVKVTYLKPYVTLGQRLSLVYEVNVWGKDEAQRDSLAEGAMMALFKEEEALNEQGLFLKLLDGANIEEPGVEALGKRVRYEVEADLIVKIDVDRMEKIDVRKPERI
ncbi:MAG: hypothetical protein V1924_06795 [Candidatus Bathyarchaeota archaeon]